MVKSARDNGLASLYHYQSFDVKRLRDIVCNRQIYFSKPADFNDPWDCKPYYNSACLSDPDMLERHVNDYMTKTRLEMPDVPEPEIERRAAVFRSNPDSLKSLIHSMPMAEAINDKYRVYCVAKKADCELMWAHYADKHRAICIEYMFPDFLLDEALEVSYSEHYPVFYVPGSDQDLLQLLSKSAAWAYENEYRLISQEQDTATPHDTLITQGGILQMPKGSIHAIILGCMAQDETVAAIQSLVNDAPSPIQLKRSVRANDRYKLDII